MHQAILQLLQIGYKGRGVNFRDGRGQHRSQLRGLGLPDGHPTSLALLANLSELSQLHKTWHCWPTSWACAALHNCMGQLMR